MKNIRDHFKELFDAYMFKKTLRSIYRTAQDSWHADMAFHRWCRLAEETGIPELKTMARAMQYTPILDSRSLPRFYWYAELISGI